MTNLLVILVAYLLGSIPFGYLVVRARGGGDVRETGSGGTGATNVTRRAGRAAGVLTLALDAAKGVAAVVLARHLLTDDFGVNWWVAAAAIACVAGHVFPVWLGFRGGKGVATGLGVFLSLAPLAVLCVGVVFVAVVWATRYVSLGSVTAAALLPACVWLAERVRPQGDARAPLVATALVGGALVLFMHRANIGRLLKGTESKLKL
ncbi:MAG TPA: glycerol-3-phosphate 1-O-acyltransferase PlsY [Pyrinomonadaceae bacterium]|nr:glycerol-3-phosphate 1-O-acyltransferase PlsY [Pyrinomonadaceae bacterium]